MTDIDAQIKAEAEAAKEDYGHVNHIRTKLQRLMFAFPNAICRHVPRERTFAVRFDRQEFWGVGLDVEELITYINTQWPEHP